MKRFSVLVALSLLTAVPSLGASSPCESPPPDVFYADTVTSPAPTPPDGGVVLEASIDPLIDADLFICTNPAGSEMAQGANILGDPCDNALGPNSAVPVGCHETASAPVSQGQSVILRVVGLLPTEANLRYGYVFIGGTR